MGPSEKSPNAGPSAKVRTPENKNKKPLRPWTISKPKVAPPSRPPKEPLAQGGGKGAGVKKREGIGPIRSLEEWLLTGSSGSREPGLRLAEGWRSKGGLEPWGGGRRRVK